MSGVAEEAPGREIRLKTIAIMVAVVVAVAGAALWQQYRIALDRTGLELTEVVRAQARLFETLAKYEAVRAGPDGDSRARTLAQIREAHYRYRGFGRTGEVVLAERRDSMIEFLLPQPSLAYQVPPPVPFRGERSPYITRALAGESGLMRAPDHRGRQVLAAYAYVPFLEVALVAKVDVAEIRAPILREAVLTALAAVVAIAIGILLHGRLIGPLQSALFRANQELARELRVARTLADDARRGQELALVGESVAVRAMREQIERYAGTDDALLLGGPPGSGQEAVARAIHERSARAGHPFIVVDCSRPVGEDTTPLLGLAAQEHREDKTAVAEGGTLFLDLVGHLSMQLQEALAGVIDAGAAARARGERAAPDVRFIAYLPKDPNDAVAAGELHPQLGAALGRQRVPVAALSERREDIEAIALRVLQARARALAKPAAGFARRALDTLRDYSWPGNIRELQAVVERAVLVSAGTEVEIEDDLKTQARRVGGYRLTRLLGKGGMGEVWLAEHALLKRPAAVKLTQARAASTPEERVVLERRFRREAEVTAQLRSPHTVELYDFGVTEDGLFYYVMEYLEGLDLNALVRRHGVVPPERTVHLVRQACLSLGEAHDAGLVHRDIKPENLFLCRMGHDVDFVKVLDFGIVKHTDGGGTTSTATGMVVGTPEYIAPELAKGGAPSARSDIYALGCVLYRLVTGRLVFQEDTPMATLVAHIEREPEPPSTVAPRPIPGELERIVMACLTKDPARRPGSAAELRAMLDAVPFAEPWSEQRALAWWQWRDRPPQGAAPAAPTA